MAYHTRTMPIQLKCFTLNYCRESMVEILKLYESSVICKFEAGHGSSLSWDITSLFNFNIFQEKVKIHQRSPLGWFSFPFNFFFFNLGLFPLQM